MTSHPEECCRRAAHAQRCAIANMEVFVSGSRFRFSNVVFPDGSVVRDVLDRFTHVEQGVSSHDFYVLKNGRLSDLDDPLQSGAIYHLEPRLRGGKGGFGSMLRALGAQIEKTTNREACRDLSGRRLRDVNHEKEMADWLKKQAEREAEKEQRRLERLQRKLSEPKHQFTDPEYQQQCHDLSERLEDSVLKGLQASSSGQVKAGDIAAAKRSNLYQSEQPKKKKKTTATACFWTGVGGLDELSSEEDCDDDDGDEDEDSPSTSSSGCGAAAATMTTQRQEPEPQQSSSLFSGPSEELRPPQTLTDQAGGSSEDLRPSQTLADQAGGSSEDLRPSQTLTDQAGGSSEDLRPSQTLTDQAVGTSKDLKHPQAPTEQAIRSSEDLRPSQIPTDQALGSSEDLRPPEVCKPSESNRLSQQEHRSALDLSSVSSADQLESLGLDVLKEELICRGLKCGGTLSERAARLFSVRGMSPDQIDPALLAKPGKTRKK
ncbi:splicing regulator SDE2 isoform X2 [Mastacembelus armatus]|uniref:splicing regulator SDE2 isoform X2 n=1 Tax=Mastacembelus armatus TaxID=205130 RepID=UPI000E45AE98|nr:replication stress response regulator SDE2 isoform X2 [Mastacembelus armatus]